LVSIEERHVLALLRRHHETGGAKVTVDRIANATGMSMRRALVVLEGLAERRLLELEHAITGVGAVITDSGRLALDRSGGWPPQH
jgi:CTP-dependent riboflavin kinase